MQFYGTREPSGQTTLSELLPLMVLGEAGQPPRKRWTQGALGWGTKQGLPVLGPLGFSAARVGQDASAARLLTLYSQLGHRKLGEMFV